MSISNKDNSLRGARNVGLLNSNQRINGLVGAKDKLDLVKFSVVGVADLGLTLGRVSRRSSARITLRDGNGFVLQSFKSTAKPNTFRGKLAEGTYYIGVQRLRGEINYRLTASAAPAEPGEILGTARDIGVLAGTYANSELVGPTDAVDLYKFSLNDIVNLQVRVDGISAGTRFDLIRDGNANGLIDNGEILASDSSFGANSLARATQDLPPGTYFVKLESTSTQPAQYQINLIASLFGGNVSPEPGNTLPLASDTLGVLSGTRTIKEYVGALDPADAYRFTVNDLSKLQITKIGSSRDINARLVRDSNNNGLIDNGEVFVNRNDFAILSKSTTVDVPVGTYFIFVETDLNSSLSTSYQLDVVATPYGGNGLPDPGNTIFTARDLGALSGTTSLKEYVGVLDPDDFYRFTVNSPATLQARVTTSSAVSLDFDLIRDTNNNGLVDTNEILRSGTASGGDQTGTFTTSLQAGTYFLRVDPRFTGNFSSNYELSLTV